MRRQGFTLTELMVVATMTTMLAMLLASMWAGLGRPTVDAITSARITQEASFAASSFERDFGGSLPESSGRLGTARAGQWVGRMQAGDQLRLCFDGATPNGVADWGTPDSVISYFVEDGKLVRWSESDGSTFVVAQYVTEMDLSDLGVAVEIKLTFAYRNLTRTYTFVGADP